MLVLENQSLSLVSTVKRTTSSSSLFPYSNIMMEGRCGEKTDWIVKTVQEMWGKQKASERSNEIQSEVCASVCMPPAETLLMQS